MANDQESTEVKAPDRQDEIDYHVRQGLEHLANAEFNSNFNAVTAYAALATTHFQAAQAIDMKSR